MKVICRRDGTLMKLVGIGRIGNSTAALRFKCEKEECYTEIDIEIEENNLIKLGIDVL